jgi:ATP-dependent DNA helicase RecQ
MKNLRILIFFYSYSDRSRIDFFIKCHNHGAPKSRQNENIQGLYSILDYSSEPYICRRKMMLNLLGEEFDEKDCNRMCDNCQKDYEVEEYDVTEKAFLIMI